jgi:soluble lytic murein transglycosylase
MRLSSALIIPVLWSSLAAQTPEQLARTLRNKPSVPVRSSLAQYAQAHPRDEGGALALLALAVHDIESKMPARAVPVLKALDGRLPKLKDHIDFFLAQALAADGKGKEAAKVAASIGESPVATRAAAVFTSALIGAGAAEEAIQLLRARYSRLEQPAGELLLAQALEAAGDGAAAGAGYRSVFANYPRSREASEAGAAMQRLQISLTETERRIRADKLFAAGDGAGAIPHYEAALATAAAADRDLLKVRLGAAKYLARDNAGALALLRSFQSADTALDTERLHYAIAAARRLKQYELMETLAKQLIARPKDSRWRAEGLMNVANYYVASENYPASLPYFRACADAPPVSTLVAHCHWRTAFDAYRNNRPDAYQQLLAYLEAHPAASSSSAALYYLGRLAERGKDLTTAKSFYLRIQASFPGHFYAVLARERLAAPGLAKLTASPAFENLAFPENAATDFTPSGETRLRSDRARMLAAAGLDDYAERELRYHGRTGGPAHQVAMLLAGLASRRGEHDRAIRLIKGTFPGYLGVPIEAAPLSFWKLAFPLPYREDLETQARSRKLDPFLVAGLIRQESEFNPKAVSRAKAQGLMQVMPATGRELSRKLGMKGYTTAQLLDPAVSLRMGTHHFKSWLDALNGQTEATLAAYNAGKSRADRWLSWGGYREPAEFIEMIPFTETRDYVQAVMRNADFYRRLYGQAAASLPSGDAATGR